MPESSEPGGETAPAEAAVWRVKSDSGLTYCFFSAERLIRWVDGLGPQRNAMVSVDGLNWKAYTDFKAKYAGDTEAMAALEAAAEGKPASSAASAATTVIGPSSSQKAGKGPARTSTALQQQARGPQPTRNVVRSKAQPTGERRAPQVTGERPAVSDDAISGRRPMPGSASVGWGVRVAFMGAGMVVGGLGVYFGLYLAGFYELTMPF